MYIVIIARTYVEDYNNKIDYRVNRVVSGVVNAFLKPTIKNS